MLSMSDHGDEDIEAEETPEESESEPEIEARSEADMAVVPFLIPFPGKLDLDGNIATNWKKFKRTWDNSEIASGISGKDTKLRTATLLTCVGAETMDIFDGFAYDNEDDKKNIAKVIEKFEAFCIGKTNETLRDTLSTYVLNRKVKRSMRMCLNCVN
jgi:hypothetical protein